MYATIRRYRVSGGSMDDLLHEVDTGFAEDVQQLEGFIGYEVLNCGDGTLVTVSTFETKSQAEGSSSQAARWVRRNLASRYDIERLDAAVGEVAVSRAVAAMLEPAHH